MNANINFDNWATNVEFQCAPVAPENEKREIAKICANAQKCEPATSSPEPVNFPSYRHKANRMFNTSA